MKYPERAAGIAIAGALARPKLSVSAAGDGPAPRGSQFSVSRGLPHPSRGWGAAQGLCFQRGVSAEPLRVSPATRYSHGRCHQSNTRTDFPPVSRREGICQPSAGILARILGVRFLPFLEVAPLVLNQSSGAHVLPNPAPSFSCCRSPEPPSPSRKCRQEKVGDQAHSLVCWCPSAASRRPVTVPGKADLPLPGDIWAS